MSNVFSKRIPNIGALLLLLFTIGITTFFIQKNTNLIGKASPNINPQDIKITNITDTSFTVSFTTNEKSSTAINIEGSGIQNPLIFDVRDRTNGNQGEYYSHYITVSGLNPQTEYKFSIIIGDKTIINGEQPFITSTGKEIKTPTPSQYITGLIVHPDGEVAKDTIVYLNTDGAEPISTLTDSQGAYSIPLNNIRTSSLESIISLKKNQIINLEARYQNLFSKTSLNYAKGLSYIPTIILSDNYTFESQTNDVSSVSSQLSLSTQTDRDVSKIEILSPKEGQSLVDTKPTIQGVSSPNTIVKITINSGIAIIGEVKSDSNGFWSFRPSTSLSPGKHTVTVETVNNFGITKAIKQTFTVFAEGSQVQQSATPSATPKITITPTSTTTPIPSITQKVSPSPTVYTTTSPTPSEIFQAKGGNINISPTQTIESPGSSDQTLLLTFLSFGLILTGSALLFILI